MLIYTWARHLTWHIGAWAFAGSLGLGSWPHTDRQNRPEVRPTNNTNSFTLMAVCQIAAYP